MIAALLAAPTCAATPIHYETLPQRFKEVADSSPEPAIGHKFASDVVLPDAGCWRLTAQSGRRGNATFIVEGFDW